MRTMINKLKLHNEEDSMFSVGKGAGEWVERALIGHVHKAAPPAWLWEGRIPLGRVTLLEGAAGAGKSFVALDLAARVTKGTPWPDGPAQSREPADCLV